MVFFMPTKIKSLFSASVNTVAVVSPAGMPDAVKYQDMVKLLLDSGVAVKEYIARRDDSTPDYLAGSTASRIEALNSAINDPDVDLILCSRGGFGSVHLLDAVDYTTLRKRDLPVMGYSDITALHCAMLAKDAGTAIAGCNLTSLDNLLTDDLTQSSHFQALAGTRQELPQKVMPIYPGSMSKSVSARAYAGNLTVMASLCGTEYMPDFKNMILILEDVNEPLYKIDRMLTQLSMNHVFDNIAALGCGVFSGHGGKEQELLQLFAEIARKSGIPCFHGFQFGHVFPMQAVNSRRILNIYSD